MTVLGAEQLRTEVHQLKTVERHRVIQAIADAREHGDLRENAEYHAAREEQGFLEGRIMEIEHRLASANIVDVTQIPNEGKVIFGATVTLINTDTDQSLTYQIVGEDESDLKQHKISVTSPIARALIGKEEGDEVEVQAPGGTTTYEIHKVEYR
jgi:transcription elongation factor GreA